MNTIRLTPENVFAYIGKQVIFKNKNKTAILTRIVSVSKTGKTIYVENQRYKGNLVLSRKIHVIL
jgi:hypothetical protein